MHAQRRFLPIILRTASFASLVAGSMLLAGCRDEQAEVFRTTTFAEANRAFAFITRLGGHPSLTQQSASRAETYLLTVPPSEEPAVRDLLAQIGVGVDRGIGSAEASSGFDFGQDERKARREQERKLEIMIEDLGGVLTAGVAIAPPAPSDNDPSGPAKAATASVVVRFDTAAKPDPSSLVEQVRVVVAHSLPGEPQPGNVQVSVTPVTLTPVSSGATEGSGQEAEMGKVKLQRNTLIGATVVILMGFMGLLFAYQRRVGIK